MAELQVPSIQLDEFVFRGRRKVIWREVPATTSEPLRPVRREMWRSPATEQRMAHRSIGLEPSPSEIPFI